MVTSCIFRFVATIQITSKLPQKANKNIIAQIERNNEAPDILLQMALSVLFSLNELFVDILFCVESLNISVTNFLTSFTTSQFLWSCQPEQIYESVYYISYILALEWQGQGKYYLRVETQNLHSIFFRNQLHNQQNRKITYR